MKMIVGQITVSSKHNAILQNIDTTIKIAKFYRVVTIKMS